MPKTKVGVAITPQIAILDPAPWDDEELTADDLRAVDAARQEAGIPWSGKLSSTE